MSRAMVALLFSDIEGSTRLLQQLGPGYGEVLLEHQQVLREVFQKTGGTERGTEGDSFFVTFPAPSDAVAAALECQQSLAARRWPDGAAVRVRMGVHVGTVELVAGNVVGLAVHEAARLTSAGHGGQVLASKAAAELATPLPTAAGWRDLGAHRLKDLPEPMALLQLTHPALPADFPALRVSVGGTNNLPAQPTAFIGRGDEIAAIADLLGRERLVTITGTGGVGKSRIALRVAAGQVERYRDGVWLVDLTRVSDPATVGDQVAAALSIEATGPEALIDRLRDQSLLLVLDNCEHVVEAVADLVAAFLRSCPAVTLLATSREPIGVAGESVWRVPPLATDDAVALLEARGRAVNAEFRVTDDNRASVDELCRRLDAIPLAIELAAARLGSLTAEQLAGRLDQRFRLLAGGSRGGLERHRTLQATVDWSYDLLDDTEQAVLRRVGIFASGFDLDAAEQVCADVAPDVLDIVDRLVAKSLVVAEDRPRAMRYRLLETVRQYAVDRLAAADELAAARDAHLAWAARLAEDAEAPMWIGGDEALWLARLDDEDANLRTAIEWSLERGQPDRAVWILFGIFRWMTGSGRAREGLAAVERTLAAGPTGPDLALANMLKLMFESNIGPIDPESVRVARETGLELKNTRQPWLHLVTEAYTTAWSYPSGDADAAAARIDACREIASAAEGYGPGVNCLCIQPLIWVNLDAGRLDDARAVADRGLAAAGEARMSFAESRMALNRARIALAADELDDAWSYAERAIVAARRTGETFVICAATELLADIAQRRGDRTLVRDLLVSILDAVAESRPPAAVAALRERIAAHS